MDVLSELLDGVRARGALFRQTTMSGPWSLRFASGSPLTLATMLRGQAWIVPADGEPVPVGTGDIAIIRGWAPYTVTDDPGTPPQVVIKSADYCRRADDEESGDGPDGSTLLLSGAYTGRGEISERLLQALPEVLVIPEADGRCPLFDLVVQEFVTDRPGQRVMRDRLLDLMLLSTLRTWFDQSEAHAPPWYRAMKDPVVGHALRVLHADPAHPWTVASLAAESGVSRAALARRFTAQVGEPPMTYLASWRIDSAADLLRETEATVGSIARQVGYANTFALSVAFKRLRGITPTQHRIAAPPSPGNEKRPVST
ncbi:AraC family transcriptional regulator [Streptomyces sp. NBC_00825]|uniref:AraC family transcriptional regulator n=1 Tax=unclassified Streptomyces TaxID=2593676 RepID=UPI002255E2D2|nr:MULTISPECIES: AraC family transcriptional regulator [unclassified Streptomyces]WTB51844.1 AraC family transcriptional regulator [Streptomyces sp. NBC_00826]WTH95263.1 AraC family transcriptional regulator [Streptomyces sp. NBC_00825]WTI03997.1 AraC family transcriptional regulator [Streptomyces sp. NBC_00822]MCX4869590.1 AraC family transcriptional regulator [Streptomyces sp. NBC_00906]MCX4900829.1 AraC family transcriptional regulator [Streptomyces sp. NBC_00892]